ncbi:alpha/beta hydrolase family protein, partial [Klebsiella quasipneumoniae]
DGIRAVCTLGAPATADHVLRHFGPTKSEEDGQIQVDLGGRAFRIAPAFIEELQAQAHENPVKGLRAALLVMHAPSDAVVDIGEAQDLFKAARHPKSFISLDDADHLLTRPADAQYAADLIGAWASRFLPMRAERNDAPSDLRAGEVWVGEHDHAFWRSMRAGPRHLDADEPKEVGGGERGPDPKDAFRNELRRVLNRGEAVNALKRAIYTGRISPAQAKRVDEMQAVADALSLMANIVMAWNTSQMQAVLDRWSNRRQVIPPELIGKIAPTRLESINLRGVFRFPVDRYADQILPSRPNASITGTNG